MDQYRQEIDAIDSQIITLLAQRFIAVKNIVQYKKEHNIAILQPQRWEEVLENRKEKWKEVWLSSHFIEVLRNDIHHEALQIEERYEI